MKFYLSFIPVLVSLSLKQCIVLSFEYETTEFTSAVFNYTYHKDNKKYVASNDAIEFYRGKFGSLTSREQLVLPIHGHIYTPYKDFDGCSYEGVEDSDILDDPQFNNPVVVVTKGGQCSLWDKIVEAARKNFSALVEYDTDRNHAMEELKDYDPKEVDFGPSEIAYMLATRTTGKFFEALYLNGTHPHIIISAGQTTIMRLAISRTSVMFVAVSFIVLTLISLVWLVFYYIQRFRFVHNRDRTKKRLAAAAKKALAILQIRTLKKGDNDLESDEMCSICIEDFVAGDVVRELPCAHKFHKTCVDPWLLSRYNCPNCKINVLKSLQLVDRYDEDPEETEEGVGENVPGGTTAHIADIGGRRSMRAGPSSTGGPSAPPLAVVVFDSLNCSPSACSTSPQTSTACANVLNVDETAVVQSANDVLLEVPSDGFVTATPERSQEEEPVEEKCTECEAENNVDMAESQTRGDDEGLLSPAVTDELGNIIANAEHYSELSPDVKFEPNASAGNVSGSVANTEE